MSLNSFSLDRIIPGKGYVVGNVRIISWRANQLKSNGTVEEFEKIIVDLKKINDVEEDLSKTNG